MLAHLTVAGDPYACGYQVGKLRRQNLRHRLDWLVPKGLARQAKKQLKRIHAVCEERFPHYVREIEGMAEGADLDYWRLLLLNSAELHALRSGCTSIAAVQNGSVFLVHNEDAAADEERREDCALITYQQGQLDFTAFTYAGLLPGSAFVWNSYGLFWAVNYLEPIATDLPDDVTPCDFTARDLVRARDLDEAVRILQAAPDASGYHYYIGQGSRLISVEQFRSELSIEEVRECVVHTNHYQHERFASRALKSRNSGKRLIQARKLIRGGVVSLQVLADRADAPHAICGKRDECGQTVATVEFSTLDNRVRTYTPGILHLEYEFALHQLARPDERSSCGRRTVL